MYFVPINDLSFPFGGVILTAKLYSYAELFSRLDNLAILTVLVRKSRWVDGPMGCVP